MQKVFLFLLTLCVITISCNKAVKPPLAFSVTNDINDSAMGDIFIPDLGTYTMSVKVKFLSGYQGDMVTLVMSGNLPGKVKLAKDTGIGTPTFTHDFIFTDSNAVQGTYPVTLTAYTETRTPQVFNFNLHVIPADCASLFFGSLHGGNICSARSFTVTGFGATGGATNVLNINNFGNYGPGCTVPVAINCDNGTVSIPLGNYGNGVKLSGYGTYNNDSIVINYVANTTPSNGPENCTVTYKH
jgi:hypothetical protein